METRRDYGPKAAGQPLEQEPSAGDGLEVHRLLANELGKACNLGLRVQCRGGHADRLERPPAVTHAQERFRIQAAPHGPITPLPLDVRGGIDQDAVKIEQYRRAAQNHAGFHR